MAHRWKVGVLARLPEHYKRHRHELSKKPAPVHYTPPPERFIKYPTSGEILRREDVPIPVLFNKKMNEGIWGGESIIKGFRKRKPEIRRTPHFWIPELKNSVVYSEILDEYMTVVVTDRTLNLIDQNYGFDSYILKTPIQDLKSQLALDIRRKLLLALIRKDFLQNDPEKQQKLLNKYKDCLIPEEEAEWFGLSLKDACGKLLGQEAAENVPVPLKLQYRKDLIEHLKNMKEQKGKDEISKLEPSNWLSKMNPFKKSTTST